MWIIYLKITEVVVVVIGQLDGQKVCLFFFSVDFFKYSFDSWQFSDNNTIYYQNESGITDENKEKKTIATKGYRVTTNLYKRIREHNWRVGCAGTKWSYQKFELVNSSMQKFSQYNSELESTMSKYRLRVHISSKTFLQRLDSRQTRS